MIYIYVQKLFLFQYASYNYHIQLEFLNNDHMFHLFLFLKFPIHLFAQSLLKDLLYHLKSKLLLILLLLQCLLLFFKAFNSLGCSFSFESSSSASKISTSSDSSDTSVSCSSLSTPV